MCCQNKQNTTIKSLNVFDTFLVMQEKNPGE